MATSGKGPDALVDTSVAVAVCAADHEHHDLTVAALDGRRLGLSGHAAYETFSVLTRMPPPARRSPQVVTRLLTVNFPASRYLSPRRAEELLARFATGSVAGGSVYDALVGATAEEHELTLVTLDRRALKTYRLLDLDIDLLGSD